MGTLGASLLGNLRTGKWIERAGSRNKKGKAIAKLNTYVTFFDYIDKILFVLSATSSGVSIISLASIVEAPVEGSVTLFFSLTTGIVKKLLNITRNKMKKHDQILMLA